MLTTDIGVSIHILKPKPNFKKRRNDKFEADLEGHGCICTWLLEDVHKPVCLLAQPHHTKWQPLDHQAPMSRVP